MKMRYAAVPSPRFASWLFVLANSLFVVDQTEQALVLQFGKPERVEQTPGLKFKIPFVQNVEYLR